MSEWSKPASFAVCGNEFYFLCIVFVPCDANIIYFLVTIVVHHSHIFSQSVTCGKESRNIL